jgi:predicted RNA-binding Zn ribbon-like protein
VDGDCTHAEKLARTIPLAVSFGDGAPALRPASKGVDTLLGSILVAVITMKLRGDWQRIKLCAAPDCRWVFYDTAKNRLGRWCSMEVCGNRAKTRKYRSTHRADPRCA